MHPHTIIATVLGCGVIAVVAFVRPRRKREEPADYFILWGDVPFVPREMAATRETRGGEAASGSGQGIAHDIAHRTDGR